MITSRTVAQARLNADKKGFTLTEIAIVLGIIGLILGAIWVAASGVYANQRNTKAISQILNIVQGVRTLYATSATTGDAAGTDDTSSLQLAGIFPSDMTTAVLNPWGKNDMVTSQTYTVAGDAIGIELNGVPTAACITLLTGLTGAGKDSGLYYANAAASAKGATAYATTANSLALPVTVSNASTACNPSGSTIVSVAFGFKLRG